jgi:hypothetical protein
MAGFVAPAMSESTAIRALRSEFLARHSIHFRFVTLAKNFVPCLQLAAFVEHA